jgi:hypothetical protein
MEVASAQERIDPQELAKTGENLVLYSYYGFGSFFENMRQVNRFLDSLRLVLPPIAGEVRLSDFLALETLRLRAARVYDRLLSRQELLLGSDPGASLTMFGSSASRDRYEELKEATKTEVEAICDTAPEHLRQAVRQILEDLFPRAHSALRNIGGYGRDFHHEWISQRRVCMPEFFRTATSWGLAPAMISNSEVEELSRLTDPDLLRTRLLAYADDPRPGVNLKAAVERLGAWYRTSADKPALTTVLGAILGMEGHGPAYPALYLLAVDTLKKLPDSSSRKGLILRWIEDNRATPVLVDVLRSMGGEHGWYGPEDSRTLPEGLRTLSSNDFSDALSATVMDIEKQSRSVSLLDRDQFDEYLYLWKYAAGDEGPKEYLESVIAAEQGLSDLLLAYTTKTTSTFGRRVQKPRAGEDSKLRVQLLEDFGLVDKARVRAEQVLHEHPEQLSEEDRVLLRAFTAQYSSREDAR